jgi:uncharacterized repeat protein (TIGR03803 family)
VLYTFSAIGDDGNEPFAGVSIGPGGILYGTTVLGGSGGMGTVFSLTPPVVAGAQWTHTTLYSFAGGADGALPFASLTAVGGVLYGTTGQGGSAEAGTVFAIRP